MKFNRRLYESAIHGILLSSLIFGCNSAQKNQNEVADSMSNLDNGAESGPDSGMETIAILGTNDIHGSLATQTLWTREKDGAHPVQYEAAGGAVLASYVKILRSEFDKNFIWLDAGDEFQGTIESNQEQGAPMVQFFNSLHLDGAAVGNHEFDFGPWALKERMKEAKYPYLAANIYEKMTGEPAVFPNTYPHKIFNLGHLKVGVIGLSTLDTPKTTQPRNVKNLQFQDLQETTLREAKTLRKLGARIILLTAHVGLKCSSGQVSTGRIIRKPNDPQGECGNHDEMVRLLESLPVGTVDAVIAGHSHQIVHHWVAGVPVIQGGAFGRYINVIYLSYDWSQKRLVTEHTRIEGPIPVCAKVFENQNDCNGDRPAPKAGRGKLVPVKFHGQTIEPDSHIQSWLEPILEKSKVIQSQILGTAESALDHHRTLESPLGNLVADAVRHAVHSDFSLVNQGGIRAPIEKGPITFGSVFRTIPFDNGIATLEVTVNELELIMRVAESGSRGFPSVSGLQLKLIDPAYDAPSHDLNGDGKDEPWKVNRLMEIRLENGQPLDPNRLYTLATLDFLVMGGDDMAWPMSKIQPERIHLNSGMIARDAFVQYLQKKKRVNTPDAPLVDPTHPRIQFAKPSFKKTPQKKSHRSGKKSKRKTRTRH